MVLSHLPFSALKLLNMSFTFSPVADLCLESTAVEDLDKLLINTLFEVAII